MLNTISMPSLSGGEKPKLCDAHIAKNSSWIAQGEETSVIMLFVWCFVPGVPYIFLVPVLRRYVERFTVYDTLKCLCLHADTPLWILHQELMKFLAFWGSLGRLGGLVSTGIFVPVFKTKSNPWKVHSLQKQELEMMYNVHPGKLAWNPKNAGLEDDFPCQLGGLNVLLECVYHYITV